MSVVVELYEVELTKEEYERIFEKFLKENPEDLIQNKLNRNIFYLRKHKSEKKLQEISQKTHERWKFPHSYNTESLTLKVDAGSMEKVAKVKKWLEDNFGPFKNCYFAPNSKQDYGKRPTYTA